MRCRFVLLSLLAIGAAAEVEEDEFDDVMPAQEQQQAARSSIQVEEVGGTDPHLADNILVRFCTSCSYRGNFMRLKDILEQQYPHLIGNINGENYPPAPERVMLAQLVGYLQTFGMLFCFFGETIASVTGLPISPATLKYVSENRMQMFICLFLMNGFAQNLIATGAFEIEYNGEVIFSKLETNRLPTLPEIIEKLGEKGLKRTPMASS